MHLHWTELNWTDFTLPCYLSLTACFADINISQGSVATYARCGGNFNIHSTANLSRNLSVKFLKIGSDLTEMCVHESAAHFFDPPCILSVTCYSRNSSCFRSRYCRGNFTGKFPVTAEDFARVTAVLLRQYCRPKLSTEWLGTEYLACALLSEVCSLSLLHWAALLSPRTISHSRLYAHIDTFTRKRSSYAVPVPPLLLLLLLSWQEAQLSPRDRAMRRVSSWNLANCPASVQKLLVRQVLNQVSAVANWPRVTKSCCRQRLTICASTFLELSW